METSTHAAEKKVTIELVHIIFYQLLIGSGIAYIGQRMKNKLEMWGGICLPACIIVLFLLPVSSQDMYELKPWLLAPLIIGSWLYVIIRLVRLHMKKEAEITFI